MSEKTFMVCDSCKEIIEKFSDKYHIYMVSQFFTDGAGQSTRNELKLDFCRRCAGEIADSLKIIRESLESGK